MTSNSEISEKEVEAAFRAFCDACQFRDGEEQYRDFDTEKAARPELYNFGMKGMRTALEAAALARAEANAGEPVAYLRVQRKSGEKILSFEPLADLPFNREWWEEIPLGPIARPAPQPSGPVIGDERIYPNEAFGSAHPTLEDAPITRPFRDDGSPEWMQIERLFERFRVPAPDYRLRDELVVLLSWARYGERLHDRAPQPSGPVKALVERLRHHYNHARDTHHFKAAYTIEEVLSAITAGKPEQAVPSDYSEEAMLTLAREAVRTGITRSSFSQCAEWAHDEATDETAAPTAGGGDEVR